MYRPGSAPSAFSAEFDLPFIQAGRFRHDYPWGYDDGPMDNEAIRDMIVCARGHTMKLHLLTGLFEWQYTAATESDPEVRSRCPSFPASRAFSTGYIMGILDDFPGVEGLLLEVRGEDGGCECEVCSQMIDDDGSRRFGESLADYLEGLFSELWARRPDLELAITMGYRNRSTDPNYLERISRIDDPRFTVWICRPQPDGMPGRGGRRVPISHYFKRATAWVPANRMSFEDIREGCRQAADQGMLGVVTECDPGFYQTTNLWHDYDLPYDGQELCYRVKQFAFNLFTWDRDLSLDDLRQAIHRKFFDPLVPEEMAAVLMALAEKVREISWAWQGRYWPIKAGGDTVEEWVEKRDRRFWEGTLLRLRDERSLWEQLPVFVAEVGLKIRNCEVGASRRARRTLAGMRDILLDIQGPVLGPERFLCPRGAPSERDPFPIMALAREANDWIPRIEAALAQRKG